LITGTPRIGKTTLLLDILGSLRANGYTIGGMATREVCSRGVRIGFEILDLASSDRGWLAHVNRKTGPRVGKYRVNLEDLEKIGVNAIRNALQNMDVVAIDEIGPMELFSAKFKKAVKKALEGYNPVLAVVHWKAQNKLIDLAKKREDAETIIVTAENREKLSEQIIEKTLVLLKVKGRE